MKRSVSSVLAERIKVRRAVTPVKHKVRCVKFSPEEMAYEIPEDTSHFFPVGRGRNSLFAKPSRKFLDQLSKHLGANPYMARLDADVPRTFPDDRVLNQALRKLIEIQNLGRTEKRKKSA